MAMGFHNSREVRLRPRCSSAHVQSKAKVYALSQVLRKRGPLVRSSKTERFRSEVEQSHVDSLNRSVGYELVDPGELQACLLSLLGQIRRYVRCSSLFPGRSNQCRAPKTVPLAEFCRPSQLCS
eukprot:scaffold87_cov388-Prasinococcus_capsulatus_cf.AAC.22